MEGKSLNKFFELFKIITKLNSKENSTQANEIPKEIKEQYPYGEFPIKYTKTVSINGFICDST